MLIKIHKHAPLAVQCRNSVTAGLAVFAALTIPQSGTERRWSIDVGSGHCAFIGRE